MSGLDKSHTLTDRSNSTIRDQKSFKQIKDNLQMVIKKGILEQLNDRSLGRAMARKRDPRETMSTLSMTATAALQMKRNSQHPLNADLQFDKMNVTQQGPNSSLLPMRDYEDMKKMQSQQMSRFANKRASTNIGHYSVNNT